MSRKMIVCAALLFFFALSLRGFGQEGPPTPANTLTLELKNMDILDVLKILSEKGNLNIVAESDVKGRVTLFLEGVKVMDVLDIIVESNNLAYVKERNLIRVMKEGKYEQLFGTKFHDRSQLKVFKLSHVNAKDASTALTHLKTKGGKMVVDQRMNTLIVIDAPGAIRRMKKALKEIDLPLTTEVFDLRFTTPGVVEKAVKPILSPQARISSDPQTNKLIITDTRQNLERAREMISQYDLKPHTQTEIFTLNYADYKKIGAKIAKELTKGVGRVHADEKTSKLIVTDLPEPLKSIREIIKALDEKTREVLIEAKIIQISLSDEHKMGVNWEALTSRLNRMELKGRFNILGESESGVRATTGVLSEHGYTGMLELLETVGETKLLSTPRLTALDNQEARILVGSKIPYKTIETREQDGVIHTYEKVIMVDVGVKLYVTPRINEKGFILMKIKPEVSSVTSFTDGIPIVETSQTETSVLVKDGVTIVIAGLIKDERIKTVKKVPILGSIPLLGIPFRSTQEKLVKTELVIFLTPHIISGDVSTEEQYKLEQER